MSPVRIVAVGALALLVLAVLRVRARAIVARGRIRAEEADAFVRSAGSLVAAVAGGLSVIALSSSNPECLSVFRLTDIPSAAMTVLLVVAGGMVVRWVWGPGGAFVARAAGMFHRGPHWADVEYDPLVVRLVVTNAVAIGLVVALLRGLSAPMGAACLGAG